MTPIQAYNAGKDLAGWYDGVLNAAEHVAGDYALLFLGMLAATSPQRRVLDNVQLAFRALDQYLHGEAWRGFAGKSHTLNLDRACSGKPLSGHKVRAFYENLTGNPDHITIDRWIFRLYTGKEIGTSKERKQIVKRIRLASNRLGLTPRQYQAAVWCGLKRNAGLGKSEVLEPLRETILNVHRARERQGRLYV